MTSRVFIDTNVFIYLYEGTRETRRSAAADAVLARLAPGQASISAQVITEFMGAGVRRLAEQLTPSEVRTHAKLLAEEFVMTPLDRRTTVDALRVSECYSIDYLDAQIWAAAFHGGCSVILTEDTHGDGIEDVRYVDPFAEGFDLEEFVRSLGA